MQTWTWKMVNKGHCDLVSTDQQSGYCLLKHLYGDIFWGYENSVQSTINHRILVTL